MNYRVQKNKQTKIRTLYRFEPKYYIQNLQVVLKNWQSTTLLSELGVMFVSSCLMLHQKILINVCHQMFQKP